MSDILKKKVNDAAARKLYAKIREDHTREALAGLRWILIHPQGVPIDKITTAEALTVFNYVRVNMPSKLDEAEVLDQITGERITGREFLKRHKAGVYT